MEGRLGNTWRLTVNEKNFIETALHSELRIDGRGLYDYRKLTIKFGREYGSSEVQLGETHVMGFVTAQLVQPYKDRPNEGSLSIFTEFSPMADPSFEPGRPGESAVELGRVVDRGLRESRAVDTESLCVLAGKLAWAVRIDLHILDNGGNLVDAANIAALAALLTFRRPECSLGGEDGQEVIVHAPEVRDPVPLIVHHLPIAFTFGFFNNGNIVVMDPSHKEEAVMGGRLTVTVNANGDICAIQKPGGEGVLQSVIIHCMRLASSRAAATSKIIKDAVEAYNNERALQKIKRHSNYVPSSQSGNKVVVKEEECQSANPAEIGELSTKCVERLKLASEESCTTEATDVKGGNKSSELVGTVKRHGSSEDFVGGPSSWDPYSKGVDSDYLKSSLASRGAIGMSTPIKKHKGKSGNGIPDPGDAPEVTKAASQANSASQTEVQIIGEKTLKDAVKPKNRRRKKGSSKADAS